MGFKRAEWHSGLTYQQTCETCKTVLQYTDYSLDFRPWYADGFVYCPRCKTPLRHNERFALGNESAPKTVPASVPEEKPAYSVSLSEQAAAPVTTGMGAFCTNCGNRFGDNDRFCAQCGTKRG